MICPKCNTEHDLDCKFCPVCGKNMSINIGYEALRADLETQYNDCNFEDDLKRYPKGEFCTSDYERVGGYSGGSCWNDDEPQYYRDGDEPDFRNIINILVKHGVDKDVAERFISRNYHTKLCDTEYEYYGNSNEYEMYVYKIDDILEFVANL